MRRLPGMWGDELDRIAQRTCAHGLVLLDSEKGWIFRDICNGAEFDIGESIVGLDPGSSERDEEA